jgi:hypothetical protein
MKDASIIVESLFQNIMADRSLTQHFSRLDVAQLKSYLLELLTAILSAEDEQYMKSIITFHSPISANESDFLAITNLLEISLEEHGFTPKESEKITLLYSRFQTCIVINKAA